MGETEAWLGTDIWDDEDSVTMSGALVGSRNWRGENISWGVTNLGVSKDCGGTETPGPSSRDWSVVANGWSTKNGGINV